MRKKYGKAAVRAAIQSRRQKLPERLIPQEREMTLAALGRARSETSSTGQKREEFDRPQRESELIAEALRRREERLAPLRKAFANMVVRN